MRVSALPLKADTLSVGINVCCVQKQTPTQSSDHCKSAAQTFRSRALMRADEEQLYLRAGHPFKALHIQSLSLDC